MKYDFNKVAVKGAGDSLAKQAFDLDVAKPEIWNSSLEEAVMNLIISH